MALWFSLLLLSFGRCYLCGGSPTRTAINFVSVPAIAAGAALSTTNLPPRKTSGISGIEMNAVRVPEEEPNTPAKASVNATTAALVAWEDLALAYTRNPRNCRIRSLHPGQNPSFIDFSGRHLGVKRSFNAAAVDAVSSLTSSLDPQTYTCTLWPTKGDNLAFNSAASSSKSLQRGPWEPTVFPNRANSEEVDFSRSWIPSASWLTASAFCFAESAVPFAVPAISEAPCARSWAVFADEPASLSRVMSIDWMFPSSAFTHLSATNSPPTPINTKIHPISPMNVIHPGVWSSLTSGNRIGLNFAHTRRTNFASSWTSSGPSRRTPNVTSLVIQRRSEKWWARVFSKPSLVFSSFWISSGDNGATEEIRENVRLMKSFNRQMCALVL
jgi:hypothetical protein